jgi:hypothetical protein
LCGLSSTDNQLWKSSNAGIGCDAKVALDIHNLREENPEKFYNQVMPSLNPNGVVDL